MGQNTANASRSPKAAIPAGAPSRGFDARRAMLLLDGVFLLAALVFGILAPCGWWYDHALGFRIYDHCDPAGPYVGSALHFFGSDQSLPFVGHPGLTLQLLIWLIAAFGYGVHHLAGGAGSFMVFWAKNIRWLFAAATVMIAACHVLSFHLLLAVCRRLLDDARAAFLAVLAYATLMPTLYCFTRISPEPILVALTLATLLYIWRTDEALAAGRGNTAWLFACAAGFAAAGAVLTKLHLAYPLIPLALAMLLFQSRGDGRPLAKAITHRILPALYYALSAGGLLYLGSYKLDWHAFLGTWSNVAPGHGRTAMSAAAPPAHVGSVATLAKGVLDALATNISRYNPLPDSPAFLYNSFFTLAEGLFLVCAAVGLVWYLRARPEKRRIVLWPLLYLALLLPVLAYRGAWHYFFLHLALAAAFFAFFLRRLIAFMCAGEGDAPFLRHGIALVLLVHAPAIAFVVSLKVNDVATYKHDYAIYDQALGMIHPNQRIAVISATRPRLWHIHGAYLEWLPRTARFQKAFEGLFIHERDAGSLSRARAKSAKVGAVLDLTADPPRVVPIKQWEFPAASPAPKATPRIDDDGPRPDEVPGP